MSAEQLKQLQGQGVSNILQTVIAAGILWTAVSITDALTLLQVHEYRITQLEQVEG